MSQTTDRRARGGGVRRGAWSGEKYGSGSGRELHGEKLYDQKVRLQSPKLLKKIGNAPTAVRSYRTNCTSTASTTTIDVVGTWASSAPHFCYMQYARYWFIHAAACWVWWRTTTKLQYEHSLTAIQPRKHVIQNLVKVWTHIASLQRALTVDYGGASQHVADLDPN